MRNVDRAINHDRKCENIWSMPNKKNFKNAHGYGTATTCQSGFQCLTRLNPFMPLLLICCNKNLQTSIAMFDCRRGIHCFAISPNFQLLYLIHQSYPTKIGENTKNHSYGHLPVISGDFYGIIHSINGVFLVLITDSHGHNCMKEIPWGSRVKQHKLMWKTPWNSLTFRMGKWSTKL